MAAARQDDEGQNLNDFFKSLSEPDEESRQWKEYTDHMVMNNFQQFSEFLKSKCDTPIVFQPRGSSAEDLRCYFSHDVGDVDLVIYPESENVIIHDEMMEYLPESPLHVRIKGAGHPVLQSCLVENTEYVATSALKTFHPAIYGGLSSHLHLLPQLLDIVSRTSKSSQFSSCLKNKNDGPAITFDFAQSFAPFSQQLETLREPDSIRFDSSDWEWLAVLMCQMRGVEYSPEHAEVMDDYLQHVKEALQPLRDNPSGIFQGFPSFSQEVCWGDKTRELGARIQEIERGLENERGNGPKQENPVDEVKSHDNSVTPDKQSADTASKPPVGGIGPRQSADKVGSKQATDSEEGTKQDDGKKSTGCEENIQRGPNSETLPSTEETALKDSQTSQAHAVGFSDEEEERQRTAKIINYCFSHELDFESPEERKIRYAKKAKNYDRIGGVDFVPAFKARGWPKVAREWIKRNRQWPSQDTVERIVQKGFHLVVKPPKIGSSPECDFRLSFSNAEFLLSQEMNGIQKDCYLCLKKYYRAYLHTEPKILVTYHLKNILLHLCEKTGLGIWTEENRSHCMMLLLEKLHEVLTTKYLPHFFVATCNILDENYIVDPDVLESLAVKVDEIMKSPMKISELNETKDKEVEHVISSDVPRSELEQSMSVAPTFEPTLAQEGATSKVIEGVKDNNGIPKAESARKLEQPVSVAPSFGPSGLTLVQEGATSKEEGVKENNSGIARAESPRTSSTPDTRKIRATGNRFHDLKDAFLETCGEVVTMAMDGHQAEGLGPLEMSLVEEIKELANQYSLTADNFFAMFESGWKSVYLKVFLSTEPSIRQRMLVAIQGLMELFKHVLKQEDFGPGNEEAIAQRLLDPSTAQPFDLSHVLPRGCALDLLRMTLNRMEPQSTHVQDTCMDDIPLD